MKFLFAFFLTFQLSVSSATVCGNYLGCLGIKKSMDAKTMCPHHQKMQKSHSKENKKNSSDHQVQCKCCVVITKSTEYKFKRSALTTVSFIDFLEIEQATHNYLTIFDRPPTA